jgi:hypothetical protein
MIGHGQDMTHVPAHLSDPLSDDAQIDAALLRLTDLLARQVGRELVAGNPQVKEKPHANGHQQED